MIQEATAKAHDTAFALALWLLATIYLAVNLVPTRLLVEMSVDADDTAQVYFSSEQHWNDAQSRSMPVFKGYNRVVFTLPLVRLGSSVRLDPGLHAASYRILSISWLRGGISTSIPLSSISNPRSAAGRLKIENRQLVLQSDDQDPQLIVPAPDWPSTLASLAVWPGLPLLGLVLVYFARRRNIGRVRMSACFIAACALFYLSYLLHFGPILPHYDDWRYINSDPSNLIDGGWEWMTIASNDTFFLTGQLLDFLVLKLSNADFFWVRVLGLALLMLQLLAQYRVVSRTASERPSVAAIAVALGIWSLASTAYWGGTAMAYQQALPTVIGTLCLWQLCGKDGRFNARFSVLLLAACGLASGLSYISGGVLLMSLGLACAAVANRLTPARADPPSRAAWILFIIGAAALALQLVMVTRVQGSLLEHNHAVASTYPNDPRFWLFFFALYGRALGYTGPYTLIDVALAALTLFPAAFYVVGRLAGARGTAIPDSRRAWVMLAIYAGIGSATYAGIVAFGRSGFVPETASAAEIVLFGKSRFHYWPIAAMMPYAWLGWAALTERMKSRSAALYRTIACLLLLPKSATAFDHNPALLYTRSMTKTGAHCVVEHLADINNGQPVACFQITGGNYDVGPAIRRLQARQSPSYVRFMREGGLTGYRSPDSSGGGLFRSGFDEPE